MTLAIAEQFPILQWVVPNARSFGRTVFVTNESYTVRRGDKTILLRTTDGVAGRVIDFSAFEGLFDGAEIDVIVIGASGGGSFTTVGLSSNVTLSTVSSSLTLVWSEALQTLISFSNVPAAIDTASIIANSVTVRDTDGNERLTTPRIAITGNPLTAGLFALSAGFGATAGISAVEGSDTRARFSVRSLGAGQALNPTITLTFRDGAMVAAPVVVLARSGGPQPLVANSWVTTPTTLVITFLGTPVAAEIYEYSFIALA